MCLFLLAFQLEYYHYGYGYKVNLYYLEHDF
jgi:hypothetical protein